LNVRIVKMISWMQRHNKYLVATNMGSSLVALIGAGVSWIGVILV